MVILLAILLLYRYHCREYVETAALLLYETNLNNFIRTDHITERFIDFYM